MSKSRRADPALRAAGDALEDRCRLDVWLWRARLFKTRTTAARFVDAGFVRLTREGAEARVDQASIRIRVGDRLLYALNGRIVALTILALGARRGPAVEARALYASAPDAASP